MKMPKQTAAVERKSNRFAHVTTTGRVRPSGWLDILGKAAQGALAGVMG